MIRSTEIKVNKVVRFTDMGSYDEEFVKSEFSKLVNSIIAEPSARNDVS